MTSFGVHLIVKFYLLRLCFYVVIALFWVRSEIMYEVEKEGVAVLI